MAHSSLRPILVRPAVAVTLAIVVLLSAAGVAFADGPTIATSDAPAIEPVRTTTPGDAVADATELAGDAEVVAAADEDGPPAHTCCETDVKLNGRPTIVRDETSVVDKTWRRVKIVVDVPISWNCPKPAKKQLCIGIFQAALAAGTGPQQPGAVGPLSEKFEVTSWDESRLCGSGRHETTVRVEYIAIYPTDAAVEGDLQFEMTLPAGKGSINHSFSMHVISKGDRLEAKGNNIDPKNPKHDHRDPVALPPVAN